MKTLIVAALLTAGCGGWMDREGWVQEGDLSAVPPGVDKVLQIAHDLAPCRIEPWGGWVKWYAGPIDCGGVQAAGCGTGMYDYEAKVSVVGLPHFGVASRTALPHEIGHYVYIRCNEDWSEESAEAFADRVRLRVYETRNDP